MPRLFNGPLLHFLFQDLIKINAFDLNELGIKQFIFNCLKKRRE